MLTQKYIRLGTHRSSFQLEQANGQDIEANKVDPRPFVETSTADDMLASIDKHSSELQSHEIGRGITTSQCCLQMDRVEHQQDPACPLRHRP